MKTCDVCGAPLGILRFKYKDGAVCRDCYEKASHHCVETISRLTLDQVKDLCEADKGDSTGGDMFDITRRIGNFILFDDKNKNFCIPNNRMVIRGYKNPVIHPYDDIKSVSIVSDPELKPDQLAQLAQSGNGGQLIHSLKVEILLGEHHIPCDVPVIVNTVRSKSFAYRRSYEFSEKICQEVHNLI
ncbi:MAG: DUF4428 domain-containing protein [Eubacteriaceae bacterium]|jgi:hypothetical protein